MHTLRGGCTRAGRRAKNGNLFLLLAHQCENTLLFHLAFEFGCIGDFFRGACVIMFFCLIFYVFVISFGVPKVDICTILVVSSGLWQLGPILCRPQWVHPHIAFGFAIEDLPRLDEVYIGVNHAVSYKDGHGKMWKWVALRRADIVVERRASQLQIPTPFLRDSHTLMSNLFSDFTSAPSNATAPISHKGINFGDTTPVNAKTTTNGDKEKFLSSLEHIKDRTIRDQLTSLYNLYAWMNQTCPGTMVSTIDAQVSYEGFQSSFRIKSTAPSVTFACEHVDEVKERIVGECNVSRKKRKLPPIDQ
jgi:hypothetical protein